jgi:C4-dicarboxylate-binding protein DctP
MWLLMPAQDAGAQQIKLKANLQFPIANPVFGGNPVRLKQEIEQRTGNAVVIEIIDQAPLLTDHQVVEGVATGIARDAPRAAERGRGGTEPGTLMASNTMGRLLCLLVMSLLLPAGDAGAQQVTLRATLQTPVSNPFYGRAMVRFKEELEKQSESAIALQIFDNGQLFTNDQVVDAVSSGAIDIGTTAVHNFAKKVPAAAIIDQPFLFNFEALVRAAVRPESEIRKLIDEAILAESRMRILWWQSIGDNVFYSNGRDIGDPEQMKDQRVAVPGRSVAEFVAQCGGKANIVPMENMAGGIKDNTLDMALVALAAFQGRGIWKVVDTITRTGHAPTEFLLAINEQTFQSLSPRHQATVVSAARTVEREMRDRASEFEAKAYAFAQSKGVKVHDITPDQVAEWRACSAAMIVDYMRTGGELASKLMVAYGRLRTDPCCTAGPGSEFGFTRR